MFLEELKKLKELLDIGAITQEEYEEKKKKILEKI
ncbi:MAG: SHOCT domain-containing protein [Thermoproteota archaeon]